MYITLNLQKGLNIFSGTSDRNDPRTLNPRESSKYIRIPPNQISTSTGQSETTNDNVYNYLSDQYNSYENPDENANDGQETIEMQNGNDVQPTLQASRPTKNNCQAGRKNILIVILVIIILLLILVIGIGTWLLLSEKGKLNIKSLGIRSPDLWSLVSSCDGLNSF